MTTTRHRLLRPLSTLLLVIGLALPATGASAATVTAPGATGQRGCARPLFSAPQRAASAKAASSAKFASAAAANGTSRTALSRLAQDKTLWLDRCGKSFYVDQQAPATVARGSIADGSFTGVDLPAGTDPLSLDSRPGAPRTIYLDFLGGTVTGTSWNDSMGLSAIDAEPFSVNAPVDTSFDTVEQNQIYRTWLVVSEDYAPFDVNVTTRDPGAAALDRADSADQVYGTRVLVTNGGPLFDDCGCGGEAYVDVFNTTGGTHAYYQPAWVFADGLGQDGWNIGQAAAHEAGHNFGLSHDGQTTSTGTDPYFEGTSLWAPIMGASYYSALTQWSDGDYYGANNTEDDLAIIATGAPLLTDDHGDTAATAAPMDASAPATGIIGTRDDRDAFTFTASDATTLSVAPATGDTDLDVDLSVYDGDGALVAHVNPAMGSGPKHPTPDGLKATWTATLPSAPATYTAIVDGGDNGDPSRFYSDYGSLGRYQVSLETGATPPPPGDPLALTGTGTISAPAGTPVDSYPATATGGVAPYTWTATNLPTGLTLDAATGDLTGSVDTPGQTTFTVTVTDAQGDSQSATIVFDSTPPLSITTAALPNGQVGDRFSSRLGLYGVTNGVAWSIASGSLPFGLRLVPALDGTSAVVSGTPDQPGTYRFTVQVAAADGQTGRRDYKVVIAPPVTFGTAATLPGGRYKRSYRTTIVLRSPTPGLAWGIVSGTLPRGLRMAASADRTTATVHGRPTRRGTYKFRVRVRERDGDTIYRTFRIRIR